MRNRSTTIIGAGVAVAILGAVMVFAYTRNLSGTAAASPANISTLVAASAISSGAAGSSIAPFVKLTQIPAAARPADAIRSLGQLTGQAALRNIEAGEVITAAEFGAAGTPSTNTSGLAIPPGHDAITVTSPVPQAVAGYVTPGALVNLFLVAKGGEAVRLLLSNVTVLSTVPATVAAAAAAKPGTTAAAPSGDVFFTLSLTPSEAEKVIFAQTYESLWYGLVHPGDGPVTSAGQTLPTLFK
jgi:pilus assembly protein CpaB